MFNWSDQFFELVEKSNTITLFRHVSPDGDAYGSSLGLKQYLIETYPEKSIYMVSAEKGSHHDFFQDSDQVSDDIIKESLAIVCDTANAPRVDDQRYQLAPTIVKIDHHPPRDNYAHYNFVEDQISSCSQIIAMLLLEKQQPLSQVVSRYLYAGMLTDTVSFSINSVNHLTLLVASKLLESNIKVGEIHNELFKLSDNIFNYITYLREAAIETDLGLIYCYVEPDILNRFDLSVNQAKEVVNIFKEKESAQIWMLLIKEETGLYRTTIRSRETIINDIAADFGGGGHVLAAATRDLSFDQTKELIEILNNRLKS